jgi:hypothetical protein
MAAAKIEDVSMDMEAFQRAAKYTLVKYTDMHVEMKEEAMDICITAVEKYTTDIEKCTQVNPGELPCMVDDHMGSAPRMADLRCIWMIILSFI